MKRLLWLLAIVQTVLAVRVFSRMARTADGERIEPATGTPRSGGSVAVIVPVLNEIERLAPCLQGLTLQSDVVREILVVDGGSTDGTASLIARAAVDDGRIHCIDAAPVPSDVNGKAYGLKRGSEDVRADIDWILTVDADVRLQPGAVESIVAFAEERQLRILSVATSQRIDDPALALLHPSMLTTLVYRFGIPGGATTNVSQVQANGQCFLIERNLLQELGGFERVLDSICEDVTLARSAAALGVPVGFYEGGELVDVEMYRDASDAWRNWPRSLPMTDRYSNRDATFGLLEVLLVQAAPLWLFLLGVLSTGKRHRFTQMQGGLLAARVGVLAGTARAYPNRPWTYWLSPLADVAVSLEIIRRSRQRSHSWRGRRIVRGDRP